MFCRQEQFRPQLLARCNGLPFRSPPLPLTSPFLLASAALAIEELKLSDRSRRAREHASAERKRRSRHNEAGLRHKAARSFRGVPIVPMSRESSNYGSDPVKIALLAPARTGIKRDKRTQKSPGTHMRIARIPRVS